MTIVKSLFSAPLVRQPSSGPCLWLDGVGLFGIDLADCSPGKSIDQESGSGRGWGREWEWGALQSQGQHPLSEPSKLFLSCTFGNTLCPLVA